MLRTALPEIITDTLPGPKAQALIDRRAQAVPAAIRCVYPVAIARGEGAMLEDLDGNRFLDWIGGVGVLNIGYSHPEVIDAVKAQAEQYFHGMFNIVTHEGYVALAEKLAQLDPEAYGPAWETLSNKAARVKHIMVTDPKTGKQKKVRACCKCGYVFDQITEKKAAKTAAKAAVEDKKTKTDKKATEKKPSRKKAAKTEVKAEE